MTDQYRELIAVLPEPHWLIGGDRRVVAANGAAAALTGWPIERLGGVALDALVLDDQAKVERYMTMCGRSRQMILGALTFRGPGGQQIPCRCDGAVLHAAGQDASALILLRCRSKASGTSRFVALTERVEALNREIALREEAERILRQQAGLLELIHDAVCVWRLGDGELTYLNHAAEELYGWSRPEVLGRRIHDLLQTESAASRDAARRQVQDAGEWSGELVQATRSGRRITVESRMLRMLDPDGVTLVLETARDVTDARRMQAHLESSQRLEAVGRLAGGAAHEINNALQGAVGFASFVLGRLAPDDPVRNDVWQALKSTERAAAITLGLLAFSRRQVLRPSDVSLGATIEDFAPMLRQVLGPDRELRLELPPMPVMLHADRGQLEQVLLNLALNARDATTPGDRMSIRLAPVELTTGDLRRLGRPDLAPGSYASLEVEDTGLGMDQATLARIFEPFFTTKPPGKGTGLGLAVVHGIVHQTGGAIAVRSAPGHGSTFTIHLPLSPGNASAAPADLAPAAVGGSERILVVDDDAIVLQMSSRLLASEGYTVLTASDGVEALRRLGKAASGEGRNGRAPVDLVLSDIVMPAMGGRELGAELERRFPDLPVLYTSGYPGEEMVSRGLLTDGAPFIQKPFQPEQLLRTIRGLLDRTSVA